MFSKEGRKDSFHGNFNSLILNGTHYECHLLRVFFLSSFKPDTGDKKHCTTYSSAHQYILSQALIALQLTHHSLTFVNHKQTFAKFTLKLRVIYGHKRNTNGNVKLRQKTLKDLKKFNLNFSFSKKRKLFKTTATDCLL